MTLATCPKCNGTTRMPATDLNRMCVGYEKTTDTLPCDNCGGQTMAGKAFGETKADPLTGLGCLHDFKGRNAGRCYTVYTCAKCRASYSIDSSD